MIEMNNVKISKKDFLKALHILIMATTDEDLIDAWFQIIPDRPSDLDFQDIADDDETFNLAVGKFVQYSKHFKSGIHLNGRWYMG